MPSLELIAGEEAAATPTWVRSRLLGAAAIACALALCTTPAPLAATLGLGLLVLIVRSVLTADLGGAIVRRSLGVAAFAALIWLTVPWTWQAGSLVATPSGVALATLTSLRVAAIGVWAIALLAGLSGPVLGDGLGRLGAPRRLVLLLQLTVRYVSLLGATQQRLDRAMRARGFRRRADLHTLSVLAAQIALVLAHALLRARRVGLAMRARGAGAVTARDAGRDRRSRAPSAW